MLLIEKRKRKEGYASATVDMAFLPHQPHLLGSLGYFTEHTSCPLLYASYCLMAVLFSLKGMLSKIIGAVRMCAVMMNFWADELRNMDDHCFVQ